MEKNQLTILGLDIDQINNVSDVVTEEIIKAIFKEAESLNDIRAISLKAVLSKFENATPEFYAYCGMAIEQALQHALYLTKKRQ